MTDHRPLFPGADPAPQVPNASPGGWRNRRKRRRRRKAKISSAPDGKSPGDRYSEAQSRARAHAREMTLDPEEPETWVIVGRDLEHRVMDGRAASVAFHLAALHFGSQGDFETGQIYARRSTDIEADFRWVRGLDPERPE